MTSLFFPDSSGGTVSSMYDSSGDILFVGDIPVSVNGHIVFGFTDLVLYTVSNDLVNDSMPATTTDLIVAPKFDLILSEDAQTCTVRDRWFITKDIVAFPIYEIASWPWVLSHDIVSLWEHPRFDSRTVWLDPTPISEKTSGSWAKNAAGRLSAVTRLIRRASSGTLGMGSVSLSVRALTVALGLGLYLLVAGAMLWSTLAASWYNTGLGDGVSLAVLEVVLFGLTYCSVRAIVICLLESVLTWMLSIARSSCSSPGTTRTCQAFPDI